MSFKYIINIDNDGFRIRKTSNWHEYLKLDYLAFDTLEDIAMFLYYQYKNTKKSKSFYQFLNLLKQIDSEQYS